MITFAYLIVWTLTKLARQIHQTLLRNVEDNDDIIKIDADTQLSPNADNTDTQLNPKADNTDTLLSPKVDNTDAETQLIFDPPVYRQRYSRVQCVLLQEEWRGSLRKIVDFGCAELSFFKYLKGLYGVQEILCVDIDLIALEYNTSRITPFTADYLKSRAEPLHVEVLYGSITSPDPRLIDIDAVICIEIIEHVYPDTLDAMPFNIFHFIQPRVAVFTTPNADFNVLLPNFSGSRHYDHKFEWTREQFQDWATNVILRYPNYSVYFEGIGEGPAGSDHLGCCSQMAVFTRNTPIKSIDLTRQTLSQLDSNEMCTYCSQSIDITTVTSHGICTYESLSLKPPANDTECPHSFLYKVIRTEDYPFTVDNRTQNEIILHETEYKIHRFCMLSTRFLNENHDRFEIPLYELTSNKDGEFISEVDLQKILESGGWIVENLDIHDNCVPCVIFINQTSTTSSDLSNDSQYNDNDLIDNSWDTEPFWGTELVDTGTMRNEEDPKPEDTETEATVKPKDTEDKSLVTLFEPPNNLSVSSIDLSSLALYQAFDWVKEYEKSEAEAEPIQVCTSARELRNIADTNDDDERKIKPYFVSSESSVCNIRKKKKFKQVPFLLPPVRMADLEPPRVVVENGDLANNNRDKEGNNCPEIEMDDNAQPRPHNLDEYNGNLRFLTGRDVEEEDYSLEDLSREVLFDPSSDISILHESESEDDISNVVFPHWLLEILRFPHDTNTVDNQTSAHLMSQGDGIHVHPSESDIGPDRWSISTLSSDSTNLSQQEMSTNGTQTSLGSQSGISFWDPSQQQSGVVTEFTSRVSIALNSQTSMELLPHFSNRERNVRIRPETTAGIETREEATVVREEELTENNVLEEENVSSNEIQTATVDLRGNDPQATNSRDEDDDDEVQNKGTESNSSPKEQKK